VLHDEFAGFVHRQCEFEAVAAPAKAGAAALGSYCWVVGSVVVVPPPVVGSVVVVPPPVVGSVVVVPPPVVGSVVVDPWSVVVGSGVVGSGVVGVGCSVVVVGAGACVPPNQPAAHPMMSSRTMTTITPMTVFLEFMANILLTARPSRRRGIDPISGQRRQAWTIGQPIRACYSRCPEQAYAIGTGCRNGGRLEPRVADF